MSRSRLSRASRLHRQIYPVRTRIAGTLLAIVWYVLEGCSGCITRPVLSYSGAGKRPASQNPLALGGVVCYVGLPFSVFLNWNYNLVRGTPRFIIS